MRLSPSYMPAFVPSHLLLQPPLHSRLEGLCCFSHLINANQLVIRWASSGGHRKHVLNNGVTEQVGTLHKFIHFSCKLWLETCYLCITKCKLFLHSTAFFKLYYRSLEKNQISLLVQNVTELRASRGPQEKKQE